MSGPTLRRVGFRTGLAWLPAGAERLAANIRPLLGVASLWLLVSLLASLIPLLGQLTLMVLTPLLTAGLMLAFDRLGVGAAITPGMLFAAWSDPGRRGSLIGLGVVSLAGTVLAALLFVGWLTAQIDPALLEANLDNPQALAELLSGQSFGPGLLMAMSLFLFIMACLFFAVPLVMFGGLPMGRSITASLTACLQNLTAMLGLLLATIALGMAMGIILAIVLPFLSLALGQFGAFLAQLVMMAATLFVQLVLTGAQYQAFRDVWGWEPRPDSGPGDDQLLA